MKRESNIELLRIISIILVFLLHANYMSLGIVQPTDIINAPWSSFFKAFSEQLCIVAVNVFVFISGWFGIQARLKGVLSLLFQITFFHLLFVLFYLMLGISIPTKEVLKGFYFGASYWFVVSYLVLYAISPVLNSFVKSASLKEYLSVLLSFFFFEFAFGWVINVENFASGYSALSFIGIYLLARFLRKYPSKIVRLNIITTTLLYLTFTLIPVLLFFLTKKHMGSIAYSSPFVILASVFFFLIFKNLKIKHSKYINSIAGSSFSLYLIHCDSLVWGHYLDLMLKAYKYIGGAWYVLFVIIFALLCGFISVMLDKVRILLWSWILDNFIGKILAIKDDVIDFLFKFIRS